MLAIGDLFIRKDDSGSGRAIYSITAIAEDHEGTKLYKVSGLCYTETLLYATFNGVTILEEVEEEPCNPAASTS